jgi:hypothetical protein
LPGRCAPVGGLAFDVDSAPKRHGSERSDSHPSGSCQSADRRTLLGRSSLVAALGSPPGIRGVKRAFVLARSLARRHASW